MAVPLPGVGLALLFALLLSTASIFSRRGLEREPFDVLLLVSLGVATVPFLGLVAATTGFADAPLRGVALVAAGAVAGSIVGRSLYFLGINYLGPGKALSISATSPVYAAVLAAVVLHEPITPAVAVGTVGVALGLVGVSRDARSEAERGGVSPFVLAVPAVAAVFFAVSVTLRKMALEVGIAPIEAAAVNMTIGFAVVAPVVVARRGTDLLAVDRSALWNFVAASLLMAAGFLVYFFGLRVTPASVFFPLIQTQPLFAAVLSAAFLGDLEVITSRTLAGAALIVGGAALVVVG